MEISSSQVDSAIEWADGHDIDPWLVKQILRKAGLKLPTKRQQVTVTLEADVPDGMALYVTNLTVKEANGIPVKVYLGEEDNCLVTN